MFKKSGVEALKRLKEVLMEPEENVLTTLIGAFLYRKQSEDWQHLGSCVVLIACTVE